MPSKSGRVVVNLICEPDAEAEADEAKFTQKKLTSLVPRDSKTGDAIHLGESCGSD
jgi:hypothetical protein